MKLVKRRFRLVLGVSFAALVAYLFIGSLIAALVEQNQRWIAMIEFGIFGFIFVIAGAAMCFEKY